MQGDERALFVAAVRQAAQAGGSLDLALGEVGWADALADEPRTAVSALFELQGEHDATSTALDLVVSAAAGLPPGRVVLPALDGCAPPAMVEQGAAQVRGVCRGGLGDAVIVMAETPDGIRAGTIATRDLQLREVTGMAPALQLAAVSCEVPWPDDAATCEWPRAVAAAQVALAHELVGTSRAMLRQACEHALDRVQFGRPIASFQAVRHRLADALVAVEAAQAAADAAWQDESPYASMLAKAVAGRSARTVARHAQQVLAGIGFTTEHPLHRHVRRVIVLDTLFGSSRTLSRDIGTQVLQTRRLPTPIPL